MGKETFVKTEPPVTADREKGAKPNLSLVVSMYNSKPETVKMVKELFLPSLLRQVDSKTQLVIVDDGSPLYQETTGMVDGFLEELNGQAGDVVRKRFSENQGFAGAYNHGIQKCDGSVVIIVNDDIYLPKGSVRSLVNVLTLDVKTGAAGPVIDNSWSFQGINLFDRIKDLSPKQLRRIEQFSSWLRKVMYGKTYQVPGPRGILLGACLAFKKEVFDEIGPFDENYKRGLFEDADWEKRARSAGYNLVVDAATFIEHGGPMGGSISLKQLPTIDRTRAMVANAYRYGKRWDCLGSLPIDLTIALLQSSGLFSIQVEIVNTAKTEGLWDEYVKTIKATK